MAMIGFKTAIQIYSYFLVILSMLGQSEHEIDCSLNSYLPLELSKELQKEKGLCLDFPR